MPRYDLKKSHCPVCLAYGSTKGLAPHVAEKHLDFRWPEWNELAPSNWRLDQDSPSTPTATVVAINDYPGCPPWWWAISTAGSIVTSGTSNSEEQAKNQAWTQWLRALGKSRADRKRPEGAHG